MLRHPPSMPHCNAVPHSMVQEGLTLNGYCAFDCHLLWMKLHWIFK